MLWLVPTVVLAVALPLASTAEQSALSPAIPATVVVGERSDSLRQAVTIEVRLSSEPEVRAPASGVLTDLAQEGIAATAGTTLARVNDRPILAMPSSAPLYRDISSGAAGSDVRALSEYLAALALLPEDKIGDHYTSAIRSAVRAFQANIGDRQDGVFKVTYVAYIPANVDHLRRADVRVGDSIAAGTALFIGEPTVLSLDLLKTDGTPVNPSSGSIKLVAGESSIDVDKGTVEGGDLDAVHQWLESQIADGVLQSTAEESKQTISGAFVERRESIHVGAVPSSALYLGEAGSVCLFAYAGENITVRRVEQSHLASGELGVVYVDPALVGITVVRDPSTLPQSERESCA